MLSLSLSSPLTVTSPKSPSHSQSHPSACPPSNLLLSPRSADVRRLSCSAVAFADAAETAAMTSLYDVLGIPYSASFDEIKAAYRRLALSCHPDVAGDGDGDGSSEGLFIRVRNAYSTLSDPAKRADYDRRLVIKSARHGVGFSGLSASPSSFCSSPRKNWESDQCW